MPLSKGAIAQFIGTFWLVFAGCGSALLAGRRQPRVRGQQRHASKNRRNQIHALLIGASPVAAPQAAPTKSSDPESDSQSCGKNRSGSRSHRLQLGDHRPTGCTPRHRQSVQ